MKYAVMATGLLVLTCLQAVAQDFPRVETFFGYSFVRFNAPGQAPSFNSNGGTGQLVYNFNSRFGFVGDFGGYRNGRVDNTVVNFQAGPRFSFRKKKKLSFYGQALFGGAYTTASEVILVQNGLVLAQPLSRSQTRFAMLVGGGVDIRLGRHVALR